MASGFEYYFIAVALRGIGSCKHEARRGKTCRFLIDHWNGTSRRHRVVAGGGVLVGFPSRRLL